MECSFNIKTALILSGFLVFGVTNSYAQTFSPSMQNLDFIDIEEMKMMIYLPNTWQSTFQNGVVEMWDIQNPIAGLAGALIPQAGIYFHQQIPLLMK